MREELNKAFQNTKWHLDPRAESKSGDGSRKFYTEKFRVALPKILKKYEVESFLDAPCGDWNWMELVDLSNVNYIGMDINREIVFDNQQKHSKRNIQFVLGDITSDPLPKVDMIMVRDCLFHLKHWLTLEFLKNFYSSGIPYMLITSHTNARNIEVQENGNFHLLNLCTPPFRFPEPIEWFDDTPDTGKFFKRRIGLWDRSVAKEAIDRIKVVTPSQK